MDTFARRYGYFCLGAFAAEALAWTKRGRAYFDAREILGSACFDFKRPAPDTAIAALARATVQAATKKEEG